MAWRTATTQTRDVIWLQTLTTISHMNKISFFLLLLYGMSISVMADERHGKVIGQIVSEEGNPVEGAYIFMIADMATQKIISSTLSDDDGTFSLESPCGEMVMGISCLGYRMVRMNVSIKDAETTDLGKCPMEAEINELQTVVVKGHPVRVKSMPDGFSVNTTDIASSSNSALDLLGRLPQIKVKGNEISVIGKEHILLSVNNVMQRVDKEQLADVLKGYDATLITSVDVITAPPVKYDSDGTTAMIVLHMSSKFNRYTGGNIGSEIMKGERYNGRYGVYSTGVFNNDKLFIDITPSYNHNYSYMSENATYSYDTGDSYMTSTPSRGSNDYVGGYATVQYQYNKKGYFGLNCNIGRRDHDNEFVSEENYSGGQTFNRNYISIGKPRVNASVYAEHSFSDSFTGWVETSYYSYKENNDMLFEGCYAPEEHPFMTYLSNQSLKAKGVTFANDYSLAVGKNTSLDFGFKAYYARISNERSNELTEAGYHATSQNDRIKLDDIKLNPYISTTYRPTQNLYFRLGVQVSYSKRDLDSRDMERRKLDYTNFLPDFIASWNSKAGSRLSLILTSGCIDPKFDQINPFEWRINQHSYSKGNLDLKGESHYTYKAVYSYKGSLSITGYVNQRRKEIVSVNRLVDGDVYSVTENAQNSMEYGIKPSFYYDRLKWLEISAEAYWGYKISKAIISGISEKATSDIWGCNLYTGFVFNKARTFTGYINCAYTGRQKTAVSTTDPMLDFGTGLSLFVLDRKLAFSLSGINLFASQYKGKGERQGYTISFKNRYNYPTLYFSVNYRFNNLKDATPRRQKMMRSIEQRM
ncbi:hypothetical protein E5358_14840 [Palleniella muris]|uniref:Uncharacterized protein n=1 Tax=Palleniella muris TaxID=3038145 RepID=A0AC61QLG0_9BACT|nr:hypothetical protein E5358_14840 [Palleniella muris]